MIAAARRGTREGASMDLAGLLFPRSIAVIGASQNPHKLSGRPIAYLQRFGYPGRVLPVNPTRTEVQGLHCYPDLDSIEGEIDLALIVVPARRTPDAIRACGRRGVRFAIATAAGFSETGGSGRALEAELRAAVAESGIRLMGPNCLGMIGLNDHAVPTFTSVLEADRDLLVGPVAFVSQSGAFGSFIFGEAQDGYVGMSHYINTGNELDLTVADILDGLVDSPYTQVLLAYLEGVSHGEKLLKVARNAYLRDKPLLAVKAGRSAAGARAARSHTASLAGDDAVFDALMREHGAVRVAGQEPLLDAAQVFSTLRRAKGRRLTVLSESGGAAVLMADLATASGLDVAPWDDAWQHKLAAVIPSYASPRNPVDLTATLITDPGVMRDALAVATSHPGTDMIAVMVGNADEFADPIIDAVSDFYRATDRPLAVVWTGGSGDPRRRLRELGIPCFTDPGRAAAALGLLADYSLRRPLPEPLRPADLEHGSVRAIIDQARAAGRVTLDEEESSRLVAAYGLPVATSRTVATPDDAVRAAEDLGGDVAMKVLAHEISHKSDIGGVRLGLRTPDDVRTAAADLQAAAAAHGIRMPRLLLQPMHTPQAELILGSRVDPAFGPVVVVGLGGILVEVLGDSQIAYAPTDRVTARHLLSSLRGASLLDGVRGRPAADTEAAADAVERLSWLAADFRDDIAEIDINPLLLASAGGGAVAVDALVVLRTEASAT